MLPGIILVFLVHSARAAIIYRLNDSAYALMPPLFHLDPYDACYMDPGAMYCTVELALVSDEPNELLTMIQEYSAHKTTHYNYSLLRHGICITQTCKNYKNTTVDLRQTLEACANESLYDKYKLKARVSDAYHCVKRENIMHIDNLDVTVAVICVIIFCMNIVGSLTDYFFDKASCNEAFRFLFCFSIFGNWRKLVAPAAEGRDKRLQRLKSLHGIRVLTMAFVIEGHAFLACVVQIDNPGFLEKTFTNQLYNNVISNGTLIMQTFLIISAFLLVYCWLIHAERTKLSWKMLPINFLMRWLRLTPSYAVVLALVSTWFGNIASGPLWKQYVSSEVSDCRRYWWQNLLYINNYFDHSKCMVQTWYLGADTQLYLAGSVVFLLCRTARVRKVMLPLLFLAGLLIPTVHTYFQNLNGILVIGPETILQLFISDSTFNEVYKRGHTNLSGYVIGIATAYLLYYWQKAGVDLRKYQKYRVLYWLLVPLGCLCCCSGVPYYADGPPPPLHINLLYAALMRPAFGLIVGAFIIGTILQFDDVYRGILEWRGWTTPSRLTYSAYLLHVVLIRNYVASLTTIQHISIWNVVQVTNAILLLSFIAAFFFWMLVEAPFSNLLKHFLVKLKTNTSNEDVQTKEMNPISQATSKVKTQIGLP